MIIYLLSDITDAKQFELLVDSELNKNNLNIKFILINKNNLHNNLKIFLEKHNSLLYYFEYKNSFSYLILFINLFIIFLKHKPKVVHCHLRKASFFGIIISYILRIKKRIYTRHHGNENNSKFIKGYLFDRLISYLSTDIVSISLNTTKLLRNENKKNISKIKLIYHGFDFSSFKNYDEKKIQLMKNKYSIGEEFTVIGSISRFIDWKGIDYTINAFKKFIKINPNSILILANANGPYTENILHLLKSLPDINYRIIDFEKDFVTLYKIFDIFIHVPINPFCEAFGQVYIESLASKVPSIFTKSGVGSEFLEDKKNCYIANYCDHYSIYKGLIFYTKNDMNINTKIINQGYKDVINKFSIELMLEKLDFLYNDE